MSEPTPNHEIWVDMPGYENSYGISSHGGVCRYAHKSGRQFLPPMPIKTRVDKDGYVLVKLKGKNYRLSRLVALAFVENPKHKPCVNHINGDKLDNRSFNLEWCTISENLKHAVALGLHKGTKKVKTSAGASDTFKL